MRAKTDREVGDVDLLCDQERVPVEDEVSVGAGEIARVDLLLLVSLIVVLVSVDDAAESAGA